MRLARVRNREGCEMKPRVVVQRGIELAAERRIGGLKQDFEITARQHRSHVARPGRARVARRLGMDLDGYRRRRKAAALERAACGFAVADKMADMIEKDLLAGGEPAVDVVRRGRQIRHSATTSFRTRNAGFLDDLAPAHDFGLQKLVKFVERAGPDREHAEIGHARMQSSIATMALSSELSLARMGRGVFAGAITPCHAAASKPGTPASASGGTSGRDAKRSLVVTASGRSFPAAISGSAGPRSAEHQLDIAADQIVERRRRATIGHVRHFDAGHAAEQRGGQMMEGADAAGAVAQRSLTWRA